MWSHFCEAQPLHFIKSPGEIFYWFVLIFLFGSQYFPPNFPFDDFILKGLFYYGRHGARCVCVRNVALRWLGCLSSLKRRVVVRFVAVVYSIPPPPRCHHFPQVLISNDKVCLILQECDRCKFLTHTHTHRHTLRLHTLIQLILNMFSSLALRQQSRSSETLFVRQIVFLSSSRYFHFWIQFLPQHRYTFQNACMFPIHFDPRRTDYIMYIYMNSKYTERRKDNVVVKG